MITRGVKGEKGDDGKQGPIGLPCDTCDKMHYSLTRYINEGGNRYINDFDNNIVITTYEKCILHLPEINKQDKDCDDYYYRVNLIKIIVSDSTHLLKSDIKINSLYNEVDLVGPKLYNVIWSKEGWILV